MDAAMKAIVLTLLGLILGATLGIEVIVHDTNAQVHQCFKESR